ncbi:MAG: hypothetical protein CHACPFDD_03789 [Phycisphaerae bacterium]|nr:hypothetical protein [Phycisphaerae bacterium]
MSHSLTVPTIRCLAILLHASAALTACAQLQLSRVTPTPRLTSQIFGYSVATDGPNVVVSAPYESAGAAYVFRRSAAGGWVQTQRILPPQAVSGDAFALGVALDGNFLLCGAPGRTVGGVDDCGAVFVLKPVNGVWTVATTLSAGDPVAFGRFGEQLGFRGSVMVTAAWEFGEPAMNSSDARVAYVFERSSGTWQQTARLAMPDDYNAGFNGSTSVATDGVRIVVAGTEGWPVASGVGAAYVYEKIAGAWQLSATLTPSDLPAAAEFGKSVAIAGGRIAIGAWEDTIDGRASAGSVYVYELLGGTWTQVHKLTHPSPEVGDRFGTAVALAGRTLVVGAYTDDTAAGAGAGTAHVIHLLDSGPSAALPLVGADTEAGDLFGWSVALRGDRAVVGAPFETMNRGAGYIFRVASPLGGP